MSTRSSSLVLSTLVLSFASSSVAVAGAAPQVKSLTRSAAKASFKQWKNTTPGMANVYREAFKDKDSSVGSFLLGATLTGAPLSVFSMEHGVAAGLAALFVGATMAVSAARQHAREETVAHALKEGLVPVSLARQWKRSGIIFPAQMYDPTTHYALSGQAR